MEIAYFPILAAAPGAERREGAQPHEFVLHMTRRAFLSSKSNTGAGEIEIKRACQKLWYLVQKNEDFPESMNSFDSGSIFPSSLGHDLSRNRSVVPVYAF